MGRLLIWCSGATPKILNRCPTERPKYLGIGAALLITSIFAAISMTFALDTDLGISIVFAIVFAIAWGLAILSLDRWLIASLQRQQNPWRYLILVLPRLSLAILLGVVISTPFVLQIFESDINHQITFLHQASARSYYALEADSPLEKKIVTDQNNIDRLEATIASGGSAGVDPFNDPEYRGLLSRLNSDESQQNAAYHQWQCLLRGGSADSCQASGGQAATLSHQEYLTEVAAVKQDSEAVQSRQQQILRAVSQARNSNLKQATAELPAAKAALVQSKLSKGKGTHPSMRLTAPIMACLLDCRLWIQQPQPTAH